MNISRSLLLSSLFIGGFSIAKQTPQVSKMQSVKNLVKRVSSAVVSPVTYPANWIVAKIADASDEANFLSGFVARHTKGVSRGIMAAEVLLLTALLYKINDWYYSCPDEDMFDCYGDEFWTNETSKNEISG